MNLGPAIHRLRWWVLAGWLAVAAGGGLLAGRLNPAAHEPQSFLPPDTPYARAAAALRECFPRSSGLGEASVVFERRDGRLTEEDLLAVEAVAAAIRAPTPADGAGADLAGVIVRSPASVPLPGSPLRSPDGAAALVQVLIPANFITVRSAAVVAHVRSVAGRASRRSATSQSSTAALPPGLTVSVTGSAGFGHDYAEATERSSQRIGQVTLAAVILILLLVYRAPLAALVPLAAISVAAFVAVKALAAGQHLGVHVGAAEKVFVFVLIYGAGIDYSMLLISRCRELLEEGLPTGAAAAGGLTATFPAILASAGINTLGMLMLCFASYGIFRTAGPAIAVALVAALLASVTLVPAVVGLLGRAMFWPARRMGQIGRRRLWPAVARRATARPGWVLAACLALLAVPAVRGANLTWVYDTLAELPPESPQGVGNAAAGLRAAQRHWPVGQVAPVTVLIRSDAAMTADQWRSAARSLTAALSAVPGVSDVRSLTQPIGRSAGLLVRTLLDVLKDKVAAEYTSATPPAMRLVVILDRPALALEAMNAVAQVRQAAEAACRQAGTDPEILIAGATAEMIDTRAVTRADFHRIAVLILAVVFLAVLVLLRDWALAAFMVTGTVIGYLATLGLSYWALRAAGAAGLDWKVEVFLFVVMVAVGVDYSIFLAARIAQEVRTAGVAEAVRRGVIHTGPVISSCGVIMAATLGSLMAGELKLFTQLGLALALGMLIDTFLIRPLLLPAFIAWTGRAGRSRAMPNGRSRSPGLPGAGGGGRMWG